MWRAERRKNKDKLLRFVSALHNKFKSSTIVYTKLNFIINQQTPRHSQENEIHLGVSKSDQYFSVSWIYIWLVHPIVQFLVVNFHHLVRIFQIEAPIHSSNVMLYSKEQNVTSRVGHKILEDGKRVRYLIKTGEIIDSTENWKKLKEAKSKTEVATTA